MAFRKAFSGQIPGLSCGGQTPFWSTWGVENGFYGCCNSEPGLNKPPFCPTEDLVPGYWDRLDQYYFLPNLTNATAIVTAPVVIATSLLTYTTPNLYAPVIGPSVAITSGAISVVLINMTCIALIIWLCWRQVRYRCDKQENASESEPLPSKAHPDQNRTTQMTCHAISKVNRSSDLRRLSHKTLYILSAKTTGTGSLLRALLPYATSEERQSVSSYSGNALILDARVKCEAPGSTNLTTNSIYGYVNGTVVSSKDEIIYEVSCLRGGTTICQLGQGSNTSSSLLRSQFDNSTAPGAVFLVTTEGAVRNYTEEWLHLPTKNLSVSICHAPWDAAILNVDLVSHTNRTEPMLQYDISVERYETSAVVGHFLPGGNRTTRQIMTMKKPQSFLGDLPPRQRRPIVQSDMGGQFALAKGGSGPLPGGWTAFMSGEPLITVLRRFAANAADTTHAIAADPALAAIFNNTLEVSSVSWAMSNLLTILSMSNYYSQQAAFDRVDNVTVAVFENILYPQDSLGFVILLWVLVAHVVIMAALVVMFVRNTRSTLLGNAWSALAQILESQEVREHIVGASEKSDSEMLEELKDARKEGLRARVVRRGEGSEVMVE
ncbi:hypothetical protein C7974DRAFT_474730 [Boeremia exigua]|uniref:uncharacterized protein n=1 Tax=Boeremia exigua TaxID=749465 RepID=UPI001E8E27D4|nr:uncharacterized protein C7974DRAFT_474730 [Boeremia exigua]KAH6619007.1 hypothetical protein C7974DRAFT_474730 [Boeremia exigua]